MTNNNLTSYRLTMHAAKTAVRLGFTDTDIADTFATPKAFYASKTREVSGA